MSSSYFKLSKPLQARLQQELQPGETVVWAGVPNWRAAWGSLVSVALFAIGWTAIIGTFFVIILAGLLGLLPPKQNGLTTGVSIGMLVFLTPFVVIGWALWWHLVTELRSGTRRVHAITDRRLLTVAIGSHKPIDDVPRSAINFVHSSERSDGSGTVGIGCGTTTDADGSPRPETLVWPGIADVAYVQSILDRRSAPTVSATTRARQQTIVPAALSDLPAALARAAERETRGERIAWIGRPDAAKAATWAMLAWIFAVPWLYFAVRWEMFGLWILFDAANANTSKTPFAIAVITALGGLPFVGVGLSMLGAPLWAWRWATSSVHIITDRRAVTVRRRKGAIQVASIEPSRIVSVSRSGTGARGTIRIVLGKTRDSDGDPTDLVETFWGVEEAERAEALIEDLRKRGGGEATV